MKGVIKGEDPVFFLAMVIKRITPSKFQRRLVGFAAGITKEDPFGKSQFHEPAGELEGRLCRQHVGGMPKTLSLISERRDEIRVRMTEGVDRDAARKIDILTPFLIPHPGSGTPDWNHRRRSIVRHHVTVVPLALHC